MRALSMVSFCVSVTPEPLCDRSAQLRVKRW
jgi:hypothetical protein